MSLSLSSLDHPLLIFYYPAVPQFLYIYSYFFSQMSLKFAYSAEFITLFDCLFHTPTHQHMH